MGSGGLYGPRGSEDGGCGMVYARVRARIPCRLAATTGSGGWPFPARPALARCVPGRTGSLATHGSSARRLPLRQWPLPAPSWKFSDEGRILERIPRRTRRRGRAPPGAEAQSDIKDRISMVTLCGDIAQARLLEEPTQQGWRPL